MELKDGGFFFLSAKLLQDRVLCGGLTRPAGSGHRLSNGTIKPPRIVPAHIHNIPLSDTNSARDIDSFDEFVISFPARQAFG